MVGRAGVMTESGSHPPIWSQSKQRQTGRAETIFPSPSPLPLHFINGHSKLLSRHTELTYCRPIRACLFLSHDPSTFPLCAYRVWWTGMSPARRIVCGRRAWHTAVFACLSVPSACDKWPPLAVQVVALLLTAYSSLTVHTLSLSLSLTFSSRPAIDSYAFTTVVCKTTAVPYTIEEFIFLTLTVCTFVISIT